MRRFSSWVMLLATAILQGQDAGLAMPRWLTAFPGAAESSRQLTGVVESSYVVPAKLPEVVAHYQRQFESAGVKSQANDDGMGVTLRGAAAECDLLIQVREQSAGTFARVSCAARSAQTAAGGAATTSTAPLVMPPPRRLPFSERDPHTKAVHAQAEADRRRRLEEMTKFDRPFSPRREVARGQPSDVTLEWFPWLIHMPGADRELKVVGGVDQSKKEYLESRFVTGQPMTAIHQYYEDLLNANGYKVATSRLSTGQTIGGIMQNANGFVEGSYYPNGIGGAWIRVNVSYRRSSLNEPITVRLRITVSRSWI